MSEGGCAAVRGDAINATAPRNSSWWVAYDLESRIARAIGSHGRQKVLDLVADADEYHVRLLSA